MSDFDLYNFKSGYKGTDNMRAKAQKMLGGEFSSTNMSPRASASAPSRTPMRAYKKGGHVEGERYPSEKEIQGGHKTNLHIPREMKMERSGKQVPMKHHHRNPQMKQGGFTDDSQEIPMKKGGHSVACRHKYATGGAVPMKRGGRYDVGGSVEEENPFDRMTLGMPDEPEMQQGTPVQESGGMGLANPFANMGVGQIRAKMGLANPELNDGLKRGGRPKARSNDSGYDQKLNMERAPYAMGGVGKMRHGAATSKGKPVSRRGPRSLEDTY